MSSKTTPITKAEIEEVVDYNPETGLFKWKYRHATYMPCNSSRNCWNAQYAGKPAGHFDKCSGNLKIMIKGRSHYARRLAFIIMTGEPSKGRPAHRDGDNGNLRWANLTTVKQLKEEKEAAVNSQGSEPPGKSMSPGVTFDPMTERWNAAIRIEFTTIKLGSFCTEREAVSARQEKRKQLGLAA